MENEINKVCSESDLLLYCQIVRLNKDKQMIEDDMNRSKKVDEEKPTFKGVFKNLGHSIERSVNDYESKLANVIEQISTAESVNPKIKTKEEAKLVVHDLFMEDKYGLAKMLFSSSVILDDEFKYVHKDEGLNEVSELIYGDRGELLSLKSKLEENYIKIASKSLSMVQKGVLVGVTTLSLAGVFLFPSIILKGLSASAITSTLATAGLANLATGPGALALGALLLGATLTGSTYGGMKLYNHEQVKASFRKLSADEEALFLAIQCTYIQTMKAKLEPEVFKSQLDEILKSTDNLKSDLDYYLFVENEDKDINLPKMDIFHRFDKRLIKILELN